MAKQAQVTVNMNTYIPGAVPGVREGGVIAAEGVIPIGAQLQTAFGTDKEYFPRLLVGEERGKAVARGDLLIIDGHLYTCKDGEGVYYIGDIPLWDKENPDITITATYVEGFYYLCLDGVALYKIDAGMRRIEDVTTQLSFAVRRVSSFGLRLIAGNDEVVAWSSVTNQLDFEADPDTGAGLQAIRVLGASGSLVAITPSSNGFIIYTEAGLLVAETTDNASIPFKFSSSILGGYVLESADLCTYDGSSSTYAVFRGYGLCKVSIATQETTSATVSQINPFIGMSGEVKDVNKLFPFMGGYLCMETDASYFFRDPGQGTFSSLTRRDIWTLIPGTSLCLYNDGRVVTFSMKSGVQLRSYDLRFLNIGNKVEPLVRCGLESFESDTIMERLAPRSDVVPDSISKVYNIDIEKLPKDMIVDLGVVPAEPQWGADYQLFWEENLLFPPDKADTHASVYEIVPYPLQYDTNHYHKAMSICHLFDGVSYRNSTPYAVSQDIRSSQVIVGGVRYPQADEAARRSLVNRIVFEERPGHSSDDVEDYNVGVSIEDFNIGLELENYNSTGSQVNTLRVDTTDFHIQGSGEFTGRSEGLNHTIMLEGQFRLNAISATLLPRGFR